MDQVCGIDTKLYPLPLTEKQKENICQKQTDPHIWIAPFMATNIVQNILDDLLRLIRPMRNIIKLTRGFKNKLIALDSEYQNGLANCQLKLSSLRTMPLAIWRKLMVCGRLLLPDYHRTLKPSRRIN